MFRTACQVKIYRDYKVWHEKSKNFFACEVIRTGDTLTNLTVSVLWIEF